MPLEPSLQLRLKPDDCSRSLRRLPVHVSSACVYSGFGEIKRNVQMKGYVKIISLPSTFIFAPEVSSA